MAHTWNKGRVSKLEEGRHLEALGGLCKAVERDPECAEAYNKRGIPNPECRKSKIQPTAL